MFKLFSLVSEHTVRITILKMKKIHFGNLLRISEKLIFEKFSEETDFAG